jgi:D-alanyl-D-alanine carboxypeptidase/D-alanyl-D-alanine-endopeptidase (penicillin-binding protein 4)
MKGKRSHWFFFSALVFVFLLQALSSSGEEKAGADYGALKAAVQKVVKGTKMEGARVGIQVVGAESGEVIYALGEDEALNPASGIKVLTALAALHFLGPEFRFKTSIYTGGKKKGEAQNLYLVGEGDPSFETMHLREMVAGLVEKGIGRVDGDIVVDDSYFDDKLLPYGFDHYPKSDEESAFRAPVGAASINANTLRIAVYPGEGPGAAALVSVFPMGYVDITNEAVTVPKGKSDIKIATSVSGSRMKVRVWGSVASGKGGVFRRRAEDPAMLSGYGLAQVLRERGIEFKGVVKRGRVPEKAVLLSRRASEPLGALLAKLGKESENFYAEQILKVVGAQVKGQPGTSENGAAAILDLLKEAGGGLAENVIRNGSGLYDADAVAASSLTAALRFAYLSPELGAEFLSQLAIGGVDGTLSGRLGSKEAKRHVRAKTGTLKGVTSLSGCVLAPAGKETVCFSIIVNNAAGKISYFRAMQDDIVAEVAKYLYAD